MSTPKIFESEYRFCLILWEHEPLPSAELAKLCKERLGWSRTTTYTVIHRLGERGIVKNENGLVQLCRLRLVLGDEGGDEAVFVFYDAALA